jgi:predicted Rossmann fold flavoprotein
MNIIVIGGGASGLMAAITAAKGGHSVTLLERQARVGRKLLSTGNGRCNLTNLNMGLPYYHGQDAAFIRPAFEALSLDATLDFFHGLGLLTTAEDNGRVYPYSDQAGSVVDVLRFAADAAGVTTRAGFEVTGLKKTKRGFTVLSARKPSRRTGSSSAAAAWLAVSWAGPAAAMSCCNSWATASPSCIPHWYRSRRTTPLSRL